MTMKCDISYLAILYKDVFISLDGHLAMISLFSKYVYVASNTVKIVATITSIWWYRQV